jgi:pimeloyl-ACP methyl ester carboxylesterase
MSPPTNNSLDVPGARLHYEVQGSGPALMLVGHPMGCSGFAAIAPVLAEGYTVVTYDPRGFGQSAIDDPEQGAEPDLLADDVRRVLEAVGEVPARVFGNSGGAVTGLALVARHPGYVETLVAHEPTLALVLPDAERWHAGIEEIYETYLREGVPAAGKRFSAFVAEMGMRPQQQDGESRPPTAEELAAADRVFGHGLVPIVLYEPEFSALQAASTRIVVAGGTTSKGELSQCAAATLAERLGAPLVEFPGGHTGFLSHADPFAAVLRRELA